MLPFPTRLPLLSVLITGLLLLACTPSSGDSDAPETDPGVDLPTAVADTATFAGGCFWCMEPPYDKVDGVEATISGFSGGSMETPSYKEVAYGKTNHTESVQVIYDSTKVSYKRLLRIYWHNVDPFDGTGQFCDRGSQYRPAIFAHNAEQRRLAKKSTSTVAAQFSTPIAVEIHDYKAFYAAKKYHQNYYKKNLGEYKNYRQGCGRDARLEEIWGDAAGGDAPLSR
ncbi:MAG: peptide-methionine (S)-S-oxide reductase [Bacteroidetes bacterium SW_9_63_38]|nr:MAG: peptide-methionine (S)-S-oxide reductase [Bacteroidetes bacterium SW_9_63_38]